MKIALFALLCACATDACAHAALIAATPARDAQLAVPPTRVELQFNEPLEQKFSHLSVSDATGKPIADGAGNPAGTHPKGLVLELPALLPGRYRVTWSVLTSDSHRTKGSYSFSLR